MTASSERAERRSASAHPAGRRPDVPASQRLRINEIFYSLQGESSHAGRPCVLVRLTGCQMRCRWCDSEYSFYDGAWQTVDEVVGRVAAFGCPLVEVTGGEPLLQPGCLTLLEALCDRGHEVLLETGGGIDIAPVDRRVRRILDVKCPGSGEAKNNRWRNLDLLRDGDEVKFVVADEADYRWARDLLLARRLADLVPVHLAPVFGELEPARLAAWILRDRLPVRLQLQLHKLIWDPAARGI